MTLGFDGKMMKIKPCKMAGSHKTGYLKGITATQIQMRLDMFPNIDDDPAKVKKSWGFKAYNPNPYRCGIWDYKGSDNFSYYSTYGPTEIFEKLFGDIAEVG